MKIIVDTNIFIDHLRGGKMGQILLDIKEQQDVDFFIPTIIIYELFAGKSSKVHSVRNRITDTIHNFKRVELTEEIAMRAGELARDIGKHISPQDYIIAASALDIGGTVLTLNKKHFEKIPGLPLYPL